MCHPGLSGVSTGSLLYKDNQTLKLTLWLGYEMRRSVCGGYQLNQPLWLSFLGGGMLPPSSRGAKTQKEQR